MLVKTRCLSKTANRNAVYVTKLLGDRPISSYSSNEAAHFRARDDETIRICVYLECAQKLLGKGVKVKE